MSQPLYGVYGVSGCGRGILPLARAKLSVERIPLGRLVFIDDAPVEKIVNGHRVWTLEEFLAVDATSRYAVIAIADSGIREEISKILANAEVEPWTIQAQNVVIMDDVELGEGAALSPFVTLTSNIRIGRHFHANLYCYIEHDCVIGDFVTLAPGVKCNGNVVIKDHAYIGSGAVIKQGTPGAPLVIGRGAVVGMGAVVTKSIPENTTVVGNPARPM